ncbi:MAG: hypothetical protein CMN76_14165 [Spirochaetaceae bacterium]|nr:hypothetical protein [Spirochaetaceae bacterium]|tara:strand:+ start:189186 stop:190262 length:1077 start_codon:yes stop_codon:yes gene_type:complete
MTRIQPVQLIQETEDYAVFYKPAGLVFFEDSPRMDFLDEMRALCQDQANRLFPVHRLDKVTSGVLLCAKGRKNANLLGNEFRFNRAEKVYVALSNRPGFKKAGMIVGDMEKSRRGSYKLLRTRDNPARTSFVSEPLNEQRTGLRLMWVRPITGKTHQIRVALKSVGFAILGDPLYNAFSEARQEDRTYLHALALRFQFLGREFMVRQIPLEGEEFLNPLCLETIKELKDPFALDYPGLKGWKKRTNEPSADKSNKSRASSAGRAGSPGSGRGTDKKAVAGKPGPETNRRAKRTQGSDQSADGDPRAKTRAEKRTRGEKPGPGATVRSRPEPKSSKKAIRKRGPKKRKGNPPGHRHSET